MTKDLLEHWITIIKPLFPERAYIRGFEKQAMSIIVDWRLNSNKARSYKRSRLIKIIFSDELISFYTNQKPGEREVFDQLIKKYIEQQLQTFQPDHDTPRGNVPPQVVWTINNDIHLPLEKL